MNKGDLMKTIIFDFNGTLFDDTKLHIKAWQAYLKEAKNYDLSEAEFMHEVFGRDNAQIVRKYFDEKASVEFMNHISEDKEAKYRVMCEQEPQLTHLIAGAESFFDYLKEKGYKMTIATGAIQSNVDYYFEKFKLDRWFDYDKVTFDDGLLPGKPDPTVYLLSMRKMQANPEDCIVFEDSLAGIEAARKAGISEIYAISTGIKHFPLPVTAVICDYYEAIQLIQGND